MIRTLALALPMVAALSAAAPAAPQVVADIRPVHALAAQVMAGVGAPGLLAQDGASPHGMTLRPSQAAMLGEAELIVGVGPALTPWVWKSAARIAPRATRLVLMDAPGMVVFETAGARDPHIWLDPANAAAIVRALADALSRLDPANADAYGANADAALARLAALEARLAGLLAPVADAPFAVAHDAYGYLEARFGLTKAAAIALSDAARPGPARFAAAVATMRARGVACVFAEPQHNLSVAEAAAREVGAGVAILDPLGDTLPTGPQLYDAMMIALAGAMADCLSGAG